MKDRETGDDYWFPNIIREVEVARSQSLQQNSNACIARGQFYVLYDDAVSKKTIGLVRELNPGPIAPESRIIPLDQTADTTKSKLSIWQLLEKRGRRACGIRGASILLPIAQPTSRRGTEAWREP
jgi:hypothetical protein